jgi:hypothetical protein
MTNQQLIIIWIVAILISALLCYIGIVKPLMEAEDDPIGEFRTKILKQKDTAAAKNYWLGALVPILILGGCAFLTTLRKKSP